MSRFLGRDRNKSQARQERRLAAYILKTKEDMLKKFFEQKEKDKFKEHLEEKYGD
jgi:hypothetical protein